MSSSSMDFQLNHRLKMLKEKKNFHKSSKQQTLDLPCDSNYLDSIYTVLGIISSTDDVKYMGDISGLQANTTPLYMRDFDHA